VIVAFSHDTLSLVLAFTNEHLPWLYKPMKQMLEEQSSVFKTSQDPTSAYSSNVRICMEWEKGSRKLINFLFSAFLLL
jgi:hypothetical protein